MSGDRTASYFMIVHAGGQIDGEMGGDMGGDSTDSRAVLLYLRKRADSRRGKESCRLWLCGSVGEKSIELTLK